MYNKSLDTFQAVADTSSFTKAADQLYISHTAVIKQINGLESRLGVKLFRRSNHGVLLTAAGLCLYTKTQEIINFSRQAVQEIQAAHFASPKIIRVGTSVLYPCHSFMDLWNAVSDRCPQYQLKIVPIENENHRLANLNKTYDFLTGPYNAEISGANCTFIPIGAYRFSISMPRKHPLARKKSLNFKDLDGETLMIMKPGNSAVNDKIREDILLNHSGIKIEDILPSYNMQTFNHCLESNTLLLSLECWENVHPGLAIIPLSENYTLPYGILASPKPPEDITEFAASLQNSLHASSS